MLNHDAGWREDQEAEMLNAMREACGDYLIVDYRGYEVFQTPTFTVALDKMAQRKRDGYGPDELRNLAGEITDEEAAAMEEAGI